MAADPSRGADPAPLPDSRSSTTVPAPRVVAADVYRMIGRLFLRERSARWAFWVLLSLAAAIAGAGIVADSDATVIGAMIVAPLMTPILGTALAVVLGDRRQVLAGVALVLAGAAAVVAIGFLLGLLVPEPVNAETSSQVAGRISPRLIDLVSALATGGVGAFAPLTGVRGHCAGRSTAPARADPGGGWADAQVRGGVAALTQMS